MIPEGGKKIQKKGLIPRSTKYVAYWNLVSESLKAGWYIIMKSPYVILKSFSSMRVFCNYHFEVNGLAEAIFLSSLRFHQLSKSVQSASPKVKYKTFLSATYSSNKSCSTSVLLKASMILLFAP